jgi:AraC-like DNA-binding protein
MDFQTTKTAESKLHIMAIDCCEHVLATLEQVVPTKLSSVNSINRSDLTVVPTDVDLIVIGVSPYPIRRLFIGQLRRISPDTPLLILRRDETPENGIGGQVRGEFLLGGLFTQRDWDLIIALRDTLPCKPCKHMEKGRNFEVVREVLRVLSERYSEYDLDLGRVAKSLPISTTHLSHILNQQVGVNFRQLLRHVRIEEAKRMLASRRYRVKDVAARVGFSDSHYFSRSFKEMTGFSASEYRARDPLFP